MFQSCVQESTDSKPITLDLCNQLSRCFHWASHLVHSLYWQMRELFEIPGPHCFLHAPCLICIPCSSFSTEHRNKLMYSPWPCFQMLIDDQKVTTCSQRVFLIAYISTLSSDVIVLTWDSSTSPSPTHNNDHQMKGSLPELTLHFKHFCTIVSSAGMFFNITEPLVQVRVIRLF